MRRAGTLFELIIVIVIVGVLVSGFSFYFTEVINMWDSNSSRSEISGQLRVGMMRISRDIRRLLSTETAQNQTFTFVMLDENKDSVRVNLRLSGSDLFYELDNLPAGSPDGVYDSSNVLLSDLTTLQFTYFDRDGNTTTTAADVYFIDVGITMQRGKEVVSINPRFFPRNFL